MVIKMAETGMLPTNTYVVTDENTKATVIIDPGEREPAIEYYIEENDLEVKGIILTHGHSDHFGGAPYYREKYGAKIYVHEGDKMLLEDVNLNSSKMILRREVTIDADIFVKDGDEIRIDDLCFLVIHTPGHTPGGMCLLIEDTLFSGDTLFCGSVGRTDFPFGDTEALLTSIRERLFVLDEDIKVYPGHMGPTGIGQEKMGNPFF